MVAVAEANFDSQSLYQIVIFSPRSQIARKKASVQIRKACMGHSRTTGSDGDPRLETVRQGTRHRMTLPLPAHFMAPGRVIDDKTHISNNQHDFEN